MTIGQATDFTMLPGLLPALLADKAYSSRALRNRLRAAGITAVLGEPAGQIVDRARRGSAGARPPAFDPVGYRARKVVERSYAHMKQGRG